MPFARSYLGFLYTGDRFREPENARFHNSWRIFVGGMGGVELRIKRRSFHKLYGGPPTLGCANMNGGVCRMAGIPLNYVNIHRRHCAVGHAILVARDRIMIPLGDTGCALCFWHELELGWTDRNRALTLLRRVQSDVSSQASLRNVVERRLALNPPSRLNDQQVLEAAADLVASGKLILVRAALGDTGFALCFRYELGRMDRNWALTLLRRSRSDMWAQASLRSVVVKRSAPTTLTKFNDEQVLGAVADMIASGELILVRTVDYASGKDDMAPAKTALSAAPPPPAPRPASQRSSPPPVDSKVFPANKPRGPGGRESTGGAARRAVLLTMSGGGRGPGGRGQKLN